LKQNPESKSFPVLNLMVISYSITSGVRWRTRAPVPGREGRLYYVFFAGNSPFLSQASAVEIVYCTNERQGDRMS
jgi:hypothetical protein